MSNSMHTRSTLSAMLLVTMGMSLLTSPLIGFAQDAAAAKTVFVLRPHCDSEAYRVAFPEEASGINPQLDESCNTFPVRDPQTLQTTPKKLNDVLDMDLVIVNPTEAEIGRIRAWIAYDPTTLQGDRLSISQKFPTPNPGETDFSASEGIVKISGFTDRPVRDKLIVVARITAHVIKNSETSSPVVFYDATSAATAHTGIFVKSGNSESNLVNSTLGSLLVRLSQSAAPASSESSSTSSEQPAAESSTSSLSSLTQTSSASSASLTPLTTDSSSSATSETSTVFPSLQVQNLRVTTEGSSAYLGWNILPSSALIGYNVYYGTISGKYIQKKAVDKSVTNITIRALPQDVQYYFALRGVNAQGEETDFSQEVAITIGTPSSSTSPLVGSVLDHSPSTPRTPGHVSGSTGPSSLLVVFLVISAIVGTSMAFRRQMHASLSL